MSGFENFGVRQDVTEFTRLKCGICWTVYDPAHGDEVAQVTPGTSFAALPADWRCPNCAAPKSKFMAIESGWARRIQLSEADAAAWGERLACAYREIDDCAMRDMPPYNDAPAVAAVGFSLFNGTVVGVMVAPWFMNVVMPAGDLAREASGRRLRLSLPAGDVEFALSKVEPLGCIANCSLFSPMFDFAEMASAQAPAEAALAALMLPTASKEAAQCRESATGAIDRRNFLCGVLTARRA
ncbi:[NiFe]-hydrogenase assembly chaperone HybE [Bradyrhizobium sp. UFLA05-109]